MSRVVDTSAWIEGIVRGAPNSRILRLLPSRGEWIVPTIVQFELAKWLHREVDEAFAGGVLGYSA